MSQTCEKPSSPRTASGERYSGKNSNTPHADGQSPGCLGTANFSPKHVRRIPIGSICMGFASETKNPSAPEGTEGLHDEIT